jgi:hypothetical protein
VSWSVKLKGSLRDRSLGRHGEICSQKLRQSPASLPYRRRPWRRRLPLRMVMRLTVLTAGPTRTDSSKSARSLIPPGRGVSRTWATGPRRGMQQRGSRGARRRRRRSAAPSNMQCDRSTPSSMPSLLSHVPAVAAANAAANAAEDNDDAAANDQMGGRSTWHCVVGVRGEQRLAKCRGQRSMR